MVKKHWIPISNKCNNACIFCLDADNQNNGKFKAKNDVINEMKIGLKNKAERVILSGGEASIHPLFIEFIKTAKDMGYKEVQTITNGRMFAYNDFCKEAVIAGLNEVTFSIHSHKRRLYEEFSGISGSYNQAVVGLKNVLAYPSVVVNMDIVINKLNYKHIYDIIKYFSEKYGVFEYDLLQIVPLGRAYKNKDALFYDINKALPYLNKVFDLNKADNRYHI
ncbi:radical SAM protein, partial [Patescibacteria group bacterium]